MTPGSYPAVDPAMIEEILLFASTVAGNVPTLDMLGSSAAATRELAATVRGQADELGHVEPTRDPSRDNVTHMPNSGGCKGAHWRILMRRLACSIEALWPG
jgi:hypothetical protein